MGQIASIHCLLRPGTSFNYWKLLAEDDFFLGYKKMLFVANQTLTWLFFLSLSWLGFSIDTIVHFKLSCGFDLVKAATWPILQFIQLAWPILLFSTQFLKCLDIRQIGTSVICILIGKKDVDFLSLLFHKNVLCSNPLNAWCCFQSCSNKR